jgi:predicted nucleic acid-binding protein
VKPFFDTNILVYAQQSGARGARARELVAEGGVASVQVLDELANVLRKKLKLDWPEVFDVLADVRDALDPPLPLTAETHEAGLALARDHDVAFYDALIVAAARDAGCATLYSEDLQHGRRFGDLTVVNPFLAI